MCVLHYIVIILSKEKSLKSGGEVLKYPFSFFSVNNHGPGTSEDPVAAKECQKTGRFKES